MRPPLLYISLFVVTCAGALATSTKDGGNDIATHAAIFLQGAQSQSSAWESWEQEIIDALSASDKIQRDIMAKDWSQLMVDADELIDGEHWSDEQILFARHQVAQRVHLNEIHTMANLQVGEAAPSPTAAIDEAAMTKEFKTEVAEGNWNGLLADASARIDRMPWTAEQKEVAKTELASHAAAFEKLSKEYAPAKDENKKDALSVEYTLENEPDLKAAAQKDDLKTLVKDADDDIEKQNWSREKKNLAKLEVAKYDKFQQTALAFTKQDSQGGGEEALEDLESLF